MLSQCPRRKARCGAGVALFLAGSQLTNYTCPKVLVPTTSSFLPFPAAIVASEGKQRGKRQYEEDLLRMLRCEAGLNNGSRAQRKLVQARGENRIGGSRLDCARTASGARRACFGIRGRMPSLWAVKAVGCDLGQQGYRALRANEVCGCFTFFRALTRYI